MAAIAGAWTCLTLQSAALPTGEAWDPQGLGTFIDGVLDAQQHAHHFAGAVVVMVRDGRVLLEKGYGYADFEARKPVDPNRTLFRIASNSKMFTWTAVMQLVEQNKLDLHSDINGYLHCFQVAPAFGEPITLEHLMTHTPGYEDHVLGLFAREADKLGPLATLLKRDQPRRVFPPGKVTAYSNYGSALAALIVEQVSQTPYETYLQERILKPLAMDHTTLAQPLPAALAGDLSKGYRWRNGRFEEQPFEFVPWAPCGAMSATGSDMGRFMIAHLNDGVCEGGSILNPETARRMRTRLTAYSPNLNGLLHGFMEMNQNGQAIYGHGGDTIYFHSLTALLPEHRTGVFVAYNTDTAAQARTEFISVLLDRLFPPVLPKEAAPPKEDRAKLARFAGTYAPARVSEDDVTKLAKLVMALSISVDADGYLVTHSTGGSPVRWRQSKALVFREVDGHRRLVFRENDRGEVVDTCWSPFAVAAWRKQSILAGPPVQFGIIGLSSMILLAGALGIPIAAVLQRRQPKPRGSRSARTLAWLTCTGFLLGMLLLGAGIKDQNEFAFGMPAALSASRYVWLAATLMMVVFIGFLTQAWRRNWWRRTGRVCLTLIAMAALVCTAWLYYWNLLI